jgi:hypothetical protein
MQTFITDYDFYKSASNLDTKRLGSQISQGIHILASLLDVNDKLINPKLNVKNDPAAKLWAGYKKELLYYISAHFDIWYNLGYKMGINWQNFNLIKIMKNIKVDDRIPKWISDELIQTHRSVLIQKEIEKEKKIIKEFENLLYKFPMGDLSVEAIKHHKKYKLLYENNYYYRKLWPDCPVNLKMHYRRRR